MEKFIFLKHTHTLLPTKLFCTVAAIDLRIYAFVKFYQNVYQKSLYYKTCFRNGLFSYVAVISVTKNDTLLKRFILITMI